VSSSGASLAVAIPSAILGAASMGVASVAQARATKQVPVHGTLRPGLLVELVRRPLWLVGMVATVLGLALQLVALGFGPLLVVQPLLMTALLFATTSSAWLAHGRVDTVTTLGALLCVVGLAGFFLLARPSAGSAAPVAGTPPGGLVLAFVAVLTLAAGMSAAPGRGMRVLSLALVTGLLYGVTAGLMKIVSGQFLAGVTEPLNHWALYAACALGPLGFLLSQNTFQQGRLVSPALAVITTVDPLVGVVIGVSWFGEDVASGPAVTVGELLAGVCIVAGIVVLSRRGAQLLHLTGDAGAKPEITGAGDAMSLGRPALCEEPIRSHP
jgi:drug/metabolite transporter (DMT)-like permease